MSNVFGVLEDYEPGCDAIKLHKSKAREVLILAPRKAGKTYSIIYDIIVNAWNNESGFPILVCAPDYKQLGQIIEYPIVNILRDKDLLKNHSKQLHIVTLRNGNEILFRSLDNPDSVRGLTCRRVYIDEVAFCPEGCLEVILPTLATHNPLEPNQNTLVMATTPDGIGSWYYEKFYSQIEQSPEDREYIKYTRQNNPFVPESYIDSMRNTMDPLMAQQELGGEWINIHQNTVYHAFSEENIIDDYTINTAEPIYVGVDYNIDINAHIFMQWDKYNNHIIVFDESVGQRTTQDLADSLVAFQDKFRNQVIIIDDATGRNRQQGDGFSNRSILQRKGLSVAGTPSNPSRQNRYAVTNAGFLNANRKHSLFITKNCRHLIKELRELTYKKNSDEVNSLGNKIGHISDSLGYAVMYLWGGNIPLEPKINNNPFLGHVSPQLY